MLKYFFTAASYFFHPLFIPLLAYLAFFVIGPYREFSPELEQLIMPLIILTIVLPLLAFSILFQLGAISSPISATLNERIYPLSIHIVLMCVLVYMMLPKPEFEPLLYFFVGLTGASLTSLFLVPFRFKISLHMMNMGSIWLYLIALGIHYEKNVTGYIALWTLMCGLIGTARLYLKVHTRWEVTTGTALGVMSQLFTLKFWL